MSDVKVKISTDNSSFSTGLKKAEGQVSTFGSNLKSFGNGIKSQFASIGAGIAGAFAITGILNFFNNLRQEMDRIQKIGQQLSLPVEEVQRLKAASGLAGSDIEALVKSMRKGQAAALDASKGNKGLSDAFKTLGVDALAFSQMGLEAKVLELAKALEQSGNEIAANDALLTILGPKAAELMPLLKSGVEAISNELQRASTVTQENIDDIAEMNDAIDRVKNDISAGLAPVIAFLFKLVSTWIIWVQSNIEALSFSIIALGDVIGTAFSDGFDAAKIKLEEYRKAFKEMTGEAGKEIKGIWDKNEPKKPNPASGLNETTEQSSGEGLPVAQSLKEKNDERMLLKKREAFSLEQKRAILLSEIETNRNRATASQTEGERELFREKILNAQDELDIINKNIEAEKDAREKAAIEEHDAEIERQIDLADLSIKERQKEDEAKAKGELEEAESSLAEGEKKLADMEANSFQLDMDQFQRAGGSYGNEGRSELDSTFNAEKQAIEEQKQTNNLLRQLVNNSKATVQGLTSA